MSEQWLLEGVDLATMATTIENRKGWEVQPGRRGDTMVVPYRHGGHTVARKWLEPAIFSVDVVIMDTLASGLPHDGDIYEGLQDNLDAFRALLYSRTFLDLQRVIADNSVRQAVVEVTAATPFLQRSHTTLEASVLFRNPEGTWRELPLAEANLAGGSDVLTVGGNAPVGDAVFTCTAASTGPAVIDVGGDVVNIDNLTAGDVLVIDCAERRVWLNGAAGDSVAHFGRAYWIELPENAATMVNWTPTDMTVDVEWFDRWL